MTTEEFTDLLQSLGGSVEEVAAHLKSDGVRGRQCDCGNCPVAVWLRNRGCEMVQVSHEDCTCWVIDRRLHAITPKAVSAFMSAFDQDEYPDLIA